MPLRGTEMSQTLRLALTFDDVLLVPQASRFILLMSTFRRVTRSLGLSIPILSAAMDTVTGADGTCDVSARRTWDHP